MHHHRGELNEMKMNEIGMEKWWNEIYRRGKRETPRENLPRLRFAHHETHMESPRRELCLILNFSRVQFLLYSNYE